MLFPVKWLMRDPFESWRYAPAITVPTLLIAADNDQVIPRASTELLLTRFKPGTASLVSLPGDHNSLSNGPRNLQLIVGARP